MNILVVDDTNDTRFLLRALLQKRGHFVVEATNGLEAFNIARKTVPDLILMDLHMPVLDGFSSIRLIRTLESIGQAPIIVISAFLDNGWKEKAIEAGCTETLSKPIDLNKFSRLINKYKKREAGKEAHELGYIHKL
jgi:CheY-like chemotaxis protein